MNGNTLATHLDKDPGNTRRSIRSAKDKYPELTWAEVATANAFDQLRYMSKARTVAEIEAVGISLADIKKTEGYDLFETRNIHNELVYLMVPEIRGDIEVLPKCWQYRWATDTDGTPQPYLMVQMPKMTRWDKLKIVPIADLHYGSTSAMLDKFREYVNYIAEYDNVFCFINGDLGEFSYGDSCKGISALEQEVRPRTQVEDLIDLLAPIAHKILWAHPGNHEDRARTRDYDPLERICERLEIPYSYEPVYVDVLWRGTPFSFFARHGNTNSKTKGGKMNAAMRPQTFHEHTMFTVMSHVHDGDVTRNTRIIRDRVNFRLAFRKQYVVITPSFFAYFGSYGSKAGMNPGTWGSINFDLFPNGDYHANA